MANPAFKATLALFAATMAATCIAEMPPIEFKGMSPGSDGTPLLTHAAWTCNSKQLSGADTVCFRKHETIAGAEAQLVMVGLKDGKVLSLYIPFSQRDFSRVQEALILKYGAPHEGRIETKTNRMGAEFTSRVSEWQQQSNHMRLEERAGKIDQSALFIRSDESTRASAQQRVEQTQKNKNDL